MKRIVFHTGIKKFSIEDVSLDNEFELVFGVRQEIDKHNLEYVAGLNWNGEKHIVSAVMKAARTQADYDAIKNSLERVIQSNIRGAQKTANTNGYIRI